MPDWPDIIRTHGPFVWKTAFRLLSHEADAADCYQQTFVAALDLAAPTEVRNWRGLLVRMATSRALDLLRYRYRQRKRFEDLPEGGGEVHDATLDHASTRELGEQLYAALADLETQQAEVFCLVSLEGHSNQEAAALLDITPAHAGVLLHRARQVLRVRLKAFDPSRVSQS